MTDLATYNFAYLDEQTKRMIRRAILKAIAGGHKQMDIKELLPWNYAKPV